MKEFRYSSFVLLWPITSTMDFSIRISIFNDELGWITIAKFSISSLTRNSVCQAVNSTARRVVASAQENHSPVRRFLSTAIFSRPTTANGSTFICHSVWNWQKLLEDHSEAAENRHSPGLQFTINKTVYKIIGAMSKDLHSEMCVHFGIDSVENLVANRRNRFNNRYGKTDNYLRQMSCWLVSFVSLYFYCVCLISVSGIYSFISCYDIRMWNLLYYMHYGWRATPCPASLCSSSSSSEESASLSVWTLASHSPH